MMDTQPSHDTDIKVRRGQAILGALREAGDWLHREKLISIAGIDDEKRGPIGRVVAFENVLIALNQGLHRLGHTVIRSPLADSQGHPVELYKFVRRT